MNTPSPLKNVGQNVNEALKEEASIISNLNFQKERTISRNREFIVGKNISADGAVDTSPALEKLSSLDALMRKRSVAGSEVKNFKQIRDLERLLRGKQQIDTSLIESSRNQRDPFRLQEGTETKSTGTKISRKAIQVASISNAYPLGET